MTKEALETIEDCKPQANLYLAAEEYAEEQAYDFKGVCDVEDYKELAELLKQAVIYGAHWKDQQMMKDAISARVAEIYYPTDSCLEIEVTLPKDKFEDGDKVIIIKQEEE